MSKFKYSDTEQQFNNVLNHQSKELSSIKRPDMSAVENCISESEGLLTALGIPTDNPPKVANSASQRVMVVPTWEELCTKAEHEDSSTTDLESLFTDDELRAYLVYADEKRQNGDYYEKRKDKKYIVLAFAWCIVFDRNIFNVL